MIRQHQLGGVPLSTIWGTDPLWLRQPIQAVRPQIPHKIRATIPDKAIQKARLLVCGLAGGGVFLATARLFPQSWQKWAWGRFSVPQFGQRISWFPWLSIERCFYSLRYSNLLPISIADRALSNLSKRRKIMPTDNWAEMIIPAWSRLLLKYSVCSLAKSRALKWKWFGWVKLHIQDVVHPAHVSD